MTRTKQVFAAAVIFATSLTAVGSAGAEQATGQVVAGGNGRCNLVDKSGKVRHVGLSVTRNGTAECWFSGSFHTAEIPTLPAAELGPKSKSDDVFALQLRLIAGAALSPSDLTGAFDAKTLAAVKAFQKKNGLADDGKVKGPTLDLLNRGGGTGSARIAAPPALEEPGIVYYFDNGTCAVVTSETSFGGTTSTSMSFGTTQQTGNGGRYCALMARPPTGQTLPTISGSEQWGGSSGGVLYFADGTCAVPTGTGSAGGTRWTNYAYGTTRTVGSRRYCEFGAHPRISTNLPAVGPAVNPSGPIVVGPGVSSAKPAQPK